MDELRLFDLGERRIIDEIFRPRYANGEHFGDDCVHLQVAGSGTLIATTDPCPKPMASVLGFEDYYYWGWLLATINLSDVAADGGTPLGLLTDLELPREMRVRDLRRLLDGLDENCTMHGTAVLGGNIKESVHFSVAATALGKIESGSPLTRRGASVGDTIMVAGPTGAFWSGVLALKAGLIEKDDPWLSAVLTPLPQLAAGQALQRQGLVSAAMDNSDGLYTSLAFMAQETGLGFSVELDHVDLSEPVIDFSERLGIDATRLMLGWGDWQLLLTAPEDHVGPVTDLLTGIGVEFTTVGRVVVDQGVFASRHGSSGALMPLDSQRFASDSWFTAGLDSYIDFMTGEDLVQ